MTTSPEAHIAGVQLYMDAIRCDRSTTPERDNGKHFRIPDFETPQVTTRRPRISDGLQRVIKLDLSRLSLSDPRDPDTKTTTRFCTPRMTLLKPRSSRKKFPVKPFLGADAFYIDEMDSHSSSRTDGVPTAHVTPSLSRPDDRKKQSNVRDSQRSRQLSSQSRRWHSSGNLPSGESEFHELRHDPDPTFDTSTFYREAEDVELRAWAGRDDGECRGEEEYYTTPRPASVEPARRVSSTTNNTGVSSGINTLTENTETDMYGLNAGYREAALYGNRREVYHRPSTPTMPLPVPHPHNPPPRGYGTYQALPSYPPVPVGYSHPDYEYPPGSGHAGQGSYSHSDPHFTSDLTHWQRHHQDQLRRQQYEAHSMVPPAPISSYTTPHAVSNALLGDPHKLDAVKKAADNIIKEKDNIIDKQKVKILELERTSKQSEVERHREMLQVAKVDEQQKELQIQDVYAQYYLPKELQYENATMKATMAEISSGKKYTEEELEKKLGATEYEMQQVRLTSEKEILSKTTDLRQAQDKLAERDNVVMEWKERYADLQKAHDSLKKQVDSMTRYFEDLPTIDDHSKKVAEIKSLKEDKSKYKHRASEYEKRLNEAQKGLVSRETLIESLEGVEHDLKSRIIELERENSRLRDRLTDKGLGRYDDDMEELRYENKKMKADISKAKKLLDSKHKKVQSLESRHKEDVSTYSSKMSEGEALITKLREEIHSKEQTVKKLRDSVKELGTQNQSLMEKGHVLSDRVNELEKLYTGEAAKLERRLMVELGVGVAELHSLVQICVQRAEGQDVNMSLLLGVKCSPMGEDEGDSSDNVTSLKQKVGKVRELRSEIEELRTLISNKYAEDMGENLNCNTQ